MCLLGVIKLKLNFKCLFIPKTGLFMDVLWCLISCRIIIIIICELKMLKVGAQD